MFRTSSNHKLVKGIFLKADCFRKKSLFIFSFFLVLLTSCSSSQSEEEWMKLLYVPLSEEILQLAENGNPEMQWVVGNCFYDGRGVEINYSKAAEWFKKSADQGYPGGQASLGFLYLNGLGGLEKDPKLGFEWIQKSVEQEDARGWFTLGQYYRLAERNSTEAFQHWTKAAEMGYPPAMANISFCYFHGYGVKQNAEKAFHFAEASALKGDPAGAMFLAYCYKDGVGVTQNPPKAVEWCYESAERGNVNAWGALADCYSLGMGVPQDYAKAFECHMNVVSKMASDWKGNMGTYAISANAIGEHYFSGRGVEQDYQKAVEYFREAATMNNVAAMNNLSKCYAEGLGVNQDLSEAEHWKQKADLIEK